MCTACRNSNHDLCYTFECKCHHKQKCNLCDKPLGMESSYVVYDDGARDREGKGRLVLHRACDLKFQEHIRTQEIV